MLLSYDVLMSIFSFRFFRDGREKTYSYHSVKIWNNLILLVMNIFYEINAVSGPYFSTKIASSENFADIFG